MTDRETTEQVARAWVIIVLAALGVVGSIIGATWYLSDQVVAGNTRTQDAIATLQIQTRDLGDWRQKADSENVVWHEQINQSFDAINRHLERLDWESQQRSLAQGPPPILAPYRKR